MSYDAKVLADSVSPNGVRLTTMQVTFPRFILAEFNTHRMFSRNSASSRAIPVAKRVAAVAEDPFVPEAFGSNKKGMQAGDDLPDNESTACRHLWREASRSACRIASELAEIGVHKQHANRLIEPFAWHTVIVTATDWRNFFALRCSPLAQPEIRTIAELMRYAMELSEPEPLADGEWHLPLIQEQDWAGGGSELRPLLAARVSAARCARVSYLTHEGKRNVDADIDLAERLARDGHMSPFEHAARPATWEDAEENLRREGVVVFDFSEGSGVSIDLSRYHIGNLRGWCSLRWTMPDEAVFGGGDL